MASGLSPADKLKSQNICATKGSTTNVDVHDIVIPLDGPLAHPRANDPLDLALLADIKVRGVKESVLVRRDGVVNGKMVLTLIDGSRRILHLIEAIVQHKAEGSYKDGQRFVEVDFFVGDDKAALLARLARNSDPLKKPDSSSVLATTAIQLKTACATTEEILAVMPRHVTRTILESMYRWPDLTREAAAAFDAGAPLALLETVLDAPRAEQASRVNGLVEAGITTKTAVTRAANAAKRANAAPPKAEVSSEAKVEVVQKPAGRPHYKVTDKVLAGVKALPVRDVVTKSGLIAGFTLAMRFAAGEDVEKDLPADILAIILNVRDSK